MNARSLEGFLGVLVTSTGGSLLSADSIPTILTGIAMASAGGLFLLRLILTLQREKFKAEASIRDVQKSLVTITEGLTTLSSEVRADFHRLDKRLDELTERVVKLETQ